MRRELQYSSLDNTQEVTSCFAASFVLATDHHHDKLHWLTDHQYDRSKRKTTVCVSHVTDGVFSVCITIL